MYKSLMSLRYYVLILWPKAKNFSMAITAISVSRKPICRMQLKLRMRREAANYSAANNDG